ncbi:hypothetical protein ACHQM5_002324 [Ranunculus cassubicifolius]
MAKSLSFLLLLCLLLFSLNSSATARTTPENPTTTTITNTTKLLTAHDELKSNGFPIGLLPTNIQTYSLNHSSGDFSVNLGDTCKLLLPPDNYLATYSKKITGKLVENRIAELKGIRVKAFYQWWSITGIRSSGENLVFEVGMVTAKYPSKNFDESPPCQGQRASA